MPLDQIDIDKIDLSTTKEKEMSFIDHLEEFRWTLIRSIIGAVITTIAVFAFKNFFIEEILMGPTKENFVGYKMICKILSPFNICFGNNLELQNIRMSGQFLAHLQISFIMGLVIAFPWVFWQIWKFVKPALHTKEVKAMRFLTFFAWLFFSTGVAFGYLIILPFSLNFFTNYNLADSINNLYHIKDYVGYITMTTLSSGLMFEMPMAIFILSKIGLVGPKDLRKYRRHALLVIIILASIITPPDVVSQVLISVPVYVLYELSIFISAWVYKKDKEKES